MRSNRNLTALAALFTLAFGLAATGVRADSVAQVGTSIRISRGTAVLIDPQGRPGMMGAGTTTAVRPGDVLGFVVHFTPVPNGATRGLGGYITVYIPRNTEVVGARFVDAAGATIRPHRGGLAADGTGTRGAVTYAAPLVGGSLSQLYADTGIFYSTDPRTTRFPDGSGATADFLTVFEGLAMTPAPTAYGQLATMLGAGGTGYAHNEWDLTQLFAFGVGGGAINPRGQGNTPDMYGSPVAGPGSWYTNEATYTGAAGGPIVVADIDAIGAVGPWARIQTFGGEIGRRGLSPPFPDPGIATRIGVLALDGMGDALGVPLHGDRPLPSYDAAAPADPWTNAVRFAVGELVVGEEYLVEISLRVLATPLDPVSGSDVVCAEVFGGDASAYAADGSSGGKDNTWRYFVPAPACVSLPLLFELDVNRLVALTGDRLTYTIRGKNLATTPQTNVTVRHCFTAGDLNFVAASGGGVRGAGGACPNPGAQDDVVWTFASLAPGEEYTFTIDFDVAGGGRTTLARAIYTSDQLPAPGFSTVAFTDIEALTIIDLAMVATPALVPTTPATVHYRATVANRGTGAANVGGCSTGCRVMVTLPTGFTYVAGSALIGGAAVANPAIAGDLLTFTAGLANIPPGGMLVLELDATVPAGTAPGAYTAGLETWLEDTGVGRSVNDARVGLAEVVVGTVRSDPPVVTAPLYSGATRVAGTTSEAAGTTIRVLLRGVEVATTTSAAGGAWSVTVPTLFVGERVSATAQAPGELESLPSAEVVVSSLSGSVACSDGADNDGDGLTDFPADPDCTSASDLDELHVPACANGVDDDGDGAVDFGADDGCRSLVDDDESGVAECGNGADDDGDGAVDFPADPGCDSAADPSERDIPECANGVDDDGDGATDYPADAGCTSALDTDETSVLAVDAGPTSTDAGASDTGVRADGGGADAAPPGPPDPGGVARPSGCGCSAGTHGASPGTAVLVALVLGTLVHRRRRRA